MLTIGVDVGGTSVRAGLVDAEGSVLDLRRAPTPAGSEALEDAITVIVSALRAEHGGRGSAVGLAVAGFISADRRHVRFSPHLPWREAAVAERVERRVGVPVLLEHDANAAAVAEHLLGAGGGAEVAVLVALGTGIGGALLVRGELYRGAHGVAPELGHLRLVPNGRPCPCGKRGCWERYCSGTALVTTTLELLAQHGPAPGALAGEAATDPGRITGRRVAAAARNGDPVALRAMGELARWLGEGLALVADVFDPDVVIVGGGVSESAPMFLDEARKHHVAAVTGSAHRPLARIRAAQLGENSGVMGAALLARSLLPGG